MGNMNIAGSSPVSNIPQQPEGLTLKSDGIITGNNQEHSTDEASARVARAGLAINEGVFSSGARSVHSGADDVATSSHPVLPDVGVDAAQAAVVAEDINYLLSYGNDGTAALMWHAMSEMARTSRQDMRVAAELRNAMQASKVQNQKNNISATEQKLEADREAAVQNFVVQVAAAFATHKAGTSEKIKSEEVGAAIGKAVEGGGQAWVKNSGAGRAADDKELEAMRHRLMEAIDDQAIESAKTNHEDAKEQHKLALRVLAETAERMTQVIQKITS